MPAVPEQPDGGLVPPVKVLRKRVNGVYRADGLSGPTRRYVLVVALLVGLASLPTLAAITAGTNELDRDTTGAMDVPFLPPPSSGPVVPVRPSPSPSSGVVHGQAGERRTPSQRYGQAGRRFGSTAGSSAGGPMRRPDGERPGAESGRAKPGPSTPPRGGTPGRPGHTAPPPDGGPVPPGHAVPPNKPADPGRPTDPNEPPFCHERGKCGVRESRHHRPDWSRHRQCGEATHRARWSHSATVHDAIAPDRSPDRSEHARRSIVTDRSSNVRPPRWGDRTHNSRRHVSESRWDNGHALARPYRGAHRTDDVTAHDRSSRVGRHHAGNHQDHFDRW
jgi:hypothetical protein